LTLREIASLAGFPWYHEFKGRGIRAQIGNAFPPVCAGVLFGHVVGHLKGVDGAAIAARAETGRAAGGPGSGCGFGRYSAEGKLC
jgi:hypothetical protein